MSDLLDLQNSLAGAGPSAPAPARERPSDELDDTPDEDNASAEEHSQDNETQIAHIGIEGVARHTLGMTLLLCVVFLWTTSNFLGSSIFADNSYAKPFFLTYLNTSTFMLAMVPSLARSAWRLYKRNEIRSQISWVRDRYRRGGLTLMFSEDPPDEKDESEGTGLMSGHDQDDEGIRISNSAPRARQQRRTRSERYHLALLPTARLSLQFCLLWFFANYFAMACLQHTTVASTTILTSTSSIFTLFFGSLTGAEKFTVRKFLGVCASLTGIFLISQVDLGFDARDVKFGESPTPAAQGTQTRDPLPHSGSFPDKSPREMLLGDALALLSAILYGLYTIILKKVSISHLPLQLNMPLFFGLVGTFNFLLLWPLLAILSVAGVEPFQLPPAPRIWTILLVNSASSLLSDLCWAYAMILTSPLVVTVGLSLTIPLSLVGEMVIQGRFESWVYWVGSLFVVGSFLFVDREETREDAGMKAEVATMANAERAREHARGKDGWVKRLGRRWWWYWRGMGRGRGKGT